MATENNIGINASIQGILNRYLLGEPPESILASNFISLLADVRETFQMVVNSRAVSREQAYSIGSSGVHSPSVLFSWKSQGLGREITVVVGLNDSKTDAVEERNMVLQVVGQAWSGFKYDKKREFIQADLAEIPLPISATDLRERLGETFDHVERWNMEDLLQAETLRVETERPTQ